MQKWRSVCLFFWVLCLPVLLLEAQAREPVESIRLTFLGTNDFHGALEARRAAAAEGREIGGIDIIAAYFQAARDDNPGGVLLLDGGDMYQGTLLSAANEGRSVINLYNQLNYDAATIGNHDFDFGPVGYHSVPASAKDDPLGVIKLRIHEARFPVLAANLVDRATGLLPAWTNLASWTLVRRLGVTVGVIGLVSTDTPLTTHPANVRGLEFRPLLPALQRLLPEVRKAGAQVIVLLIHADLITPQDGGPAGPVAELLSEVPRGEIDLVISGHYHKPFTGLVHGVPVLQAWPNGVSFTRAELFFDPQSGRAIAERTRIYENQLYLRPEPTQGQLLFLGRPIAPLTSFSEQFAVFRQSIAHLDRIQLGQTRADLQHRLAFDSPVGNLITDAMRAADREIEIAMYNSGGLRTSIPKGVVTFGRVYEVVPFDDCLVKVILTGAQIREIIEHGLSTAYGVMEISGLKVVVDPAAPPGKRCRALLTEDNQPIEDGRRYVVGTNEFMLNGGDGYFTFARGQDVEHTHDLIRELLARYIKQQGIVKPQMGGRYQTMEKAEQRPKD